MPSRQPCDPLDITLVPANKRILNTPITVDCFNVKVKNCTHYFLSHFHADHYTKLTRTFKYPVFCSETTAALVESRIGAQAVALQMYTTYNFETFSVRLIEANHCPGAVCFIFLIEDQLVFHTGDFRYNKTYHTLNIHFNCIYLDNTYENMPVFPSQKEAILRILSIFDQGNKLGMPRVCVLCCTYCVGKEKVFLSVAEYLDAKVQVSKEKMATYKCYSKYSIDLINKEVLAIVGDKRQINGTYGFKKKRQDVTEVESVNIECSDDCSHKTKRRALPVRSEEKIIPLVSSNELLDVITPSTDSCKFEGDPFSRITTEEQLVKVIGMSELNKLNSVISNVNADRVVVLFGSGWKEKVEFKTYFKPDGRKIPRGIEMVYFRYSEHSSSEELEHFKAETSYDQIINTVTE